MLQVQAFSQRAGHTRLVNSGNYWSCSVSHKHAPSYRYRSYRSIPVSDYSTDNRMPYRRSSFLPDRTGTPQSIHLAAWIFCSSRLKGIWNSLKFLILSSGAISILVSLSYSKIPLAFPYLFTSIFNPVKCFYRCLLTVQTFFFQCDNRVHHLFVILWNDLLEFWKIFIELIQNSFSDL